jgi:AAA ATPase domain
MSAAAARVVAMPKAAHQYAPTKFATVLTDLATMESAQGSARIDHLELFEAERQITVKGKPEPLRVFVPVEKGDEHHHHSHHNHDGDEHTEGCAPHHHHDHKFSSVGVRGVKPHLQQMHEVLKEFHKGSCQAGTRTFGCGIAITALAGLGKTTLARHFLAYAEQKLSQCESCNFFGVFWGTGNDADPDQLLHGWSLVFRGLIARAAGSPVASLDSRTVEHVVGAAESSPLLHRFLRLHRARRGHIETVERSEIGNLMALLLKLLRKFLEIGTVVIALDNMHLFDASSFQLLARVSTEISSPRLLTVAVTRPPRLGAQKSAAQRKIERMGSAGNGLSRIALEACWVQDSRSHRWFQTFLSRPSTSVVEVKAMSPKTVDKVLRDIWRVESIASELVDFLFEQSGGNPMLLKISAQFLRSGDLVEVDGDRAVLSPSASDLSKIPLPDQARSIALALLDELDDEARNIVKVASTFGRTFVSNTLHEIVRAVGTLEAAESSLGSRAFSRRLSELSEFGVLEQIPPADVKNVLPADARFDTLTGSLAPEHDALWRFTSGLMQDVAYSTLPGKRRRTLHASIASMFEQHSQGLPAGEVARALLMARCRHLDGAGETEAAQAARAQLEKLEPPA